jgi:hypothetical protein
MELRWIYKKIQNHQKVGRKNLILFPGTIWNPNMILESGIPNIKMGKEITLTAIEFKKFRCALKGMKL